VAKKVKTHKEKANIAQAESTTDAIWFTINYKIEQEEINQLPIENEDNNDIPELEDIFTDNSEAEKPKGIHETIEKTLLTSTNFAATVTIIRLEHKLEIYNSEAI